MSIHGEGMWQFVAHMCEWSKYLHRKIRYDPLTRVDMTSIAHKGIWEMQSFKRKGSRFNCKTSRHTLQQSTSKPSCSKSSPLFFFVSLLSLSSFCLYPTYSLEHMVFVFFAPNYLIQYSNFHSNHFPKNVLISLFFIVEYNSILYMQHIFFIHLSFNLQSEPIYYR